MSPECGYCGYKYPVLSYETETAHLLLCEPYQNAPVVEVKDGKEFIEVPHSNILVEKIKAPRYVN